jgi:hypothetical protein
LLTTSDVSFGVKLQELVASQGQTTHAVGEQTQLAALQCRHIFRHCLHILVPIHTHKEQRYNFETSSEETAAAVVELIMNARVRGGIVGEQHNAIACFHA